MKPYILFTVLIAILTGGSCSKKTNKIPDTADTTVSPAQYRMVKMLTITHQFNDTMSFEFTYNVNGYVSKCIKVEHSPVLGNVSVTFRYFYDEHGRLQSEKVTGELSQNEYWGTYHYDNVGRLQQFNFSEFFGYVSHYYPKLSSVNFDYINDSTTKVTLTVAGGSTSTHLDIYDQSGNYNGRHLVYDSTVNVWRTVKGLEQNYSIVGAYDPYFSSKNNITTNHKYSGSNVLSNEYNEHGCLVKQYDNKITLLYFYEAY